MAKPTVNKGRQWTDAELGRAMVGKVIELRELLKVHRGRLAEQRAAGPADGTPAAGGAHAALLEAGAHLVDGPHRLRWPLDDDGKNDVQGHAGVLALVGEVLAMLARPSGDDELLEDVAEIWPESRTKDEAAAEMNRIRTARTDKRVTAALADQEKAKARGGKPAAAAPPAVPKPGAAAPPPGEWVEGEYIRDDFREAPKVG